MRLGGSQAAPGHIATAPGGHREQAYWVNFHVGVFVSVSTIFRVQNAGGNLPYAAKVCGKDAQDVHCGKGGGVSRLDTRGRDQDAGWWAAAERRPTAEMGKQSQVQMPHEAGKKK